MLGWCLLFVSGCSHVMDKGTMICEWSEQKEDAKLNFDWVEDPQISPIA